MRAYNFVVSRQKFTKFLPRASEGLCLITCFPDSQYLSPFRKKISNKNLYLSEIADNFGRFLPSQILWMLNLAHLITITTEAPKTPFLYVSYLELRNWGGNASKQLAQGCYPME